MTPTARGVSMLVVCGVLYGLAWMTHIGWFYVANALAVAIFFVNVPVPWLILRGLSAKRQMSRAAGGKSADIFEDDTIGISVELRNRTLLPSFLITLQEHSPLTAPDEEQPGFFIGMLAPRGRIAATYDVRCYKRGVYTFGPTQVATSAPFGLFRAQRMLDAPLEVKVYPQVLPMSTTVDQGSLHGPTPETSPPVQSGEFRASREFHHGDYVRNIHWRNSARRGQLMVKEFDRIPLGEVRLAFTTQIDEGKGKDTTLEYAVKIAASVAKRSFQDGRPFRMWPAAPEEVLSTWHGLLEHLAIVEKGTPVSIGEFLDQRAMPGMSVLIVSAADRETLRLVREQSHLSGNLTVVLLRGFATEEESHAEHTLSRKGMTVMSCTAGGLRAVLDSLGREMSTSGSAARTPAMAAALSSST